MCVCEFILPGMFLSDHKMFYKIKTRGEKSKIVVLEKMKRLLRALCVSASGLRVSTHCYT